MSKIVTTSKLNRLWKNGVLSIKTTLENLISTERKRIDDLEDNTSSVTNKVSTYNDLMANTVEGYLPDALAVKEGFENVNDSLVNENNESFNFGYLNGVRGFFTNPSRADDSFVPFKSCSYSQIEYEIIDQITSKAKVEFTASADVNNGLLFVAIASEQTVTVPITENTSGSASFTLLSDVSAKCTSYKGFSRTLCYKVSSLKKGDTISITGLYLRSCGVHLIKLADDINTELYTFETTDNKDDIECTMAEDLDKGIVFVACGTGVDGPTYLPIYTDCGKTTSDININSEISYEVSSSSRIGTIVNAKAGSTIMAYRSYSRAQAMHVFKLS